MELPDLPLALVREFSRPRVSKEGREVYQKYVALFGPSQAVLRKMVTPHNVSVVAAYIREQEVVEELLRSYGKTLYYSTQAARLREVLNEQYERVRLSHRAVCDLLVREDVRNLENVARICIDIDRILFHSIV